MRDVRAFVRERLPEGAFLKRDRGEALYVTNAPALGWDGVLPGFRTEVSGKLAFIFILPETLESVGGRDDALSQSLLRFTGCSDAAAGLMDAIIKAGESRDAAGMDACDRNLRMAAAVALRAGGGEGLYFCARALAGYRDVI